MMTARKQGADQNQSQMAHDLSMTFRLRGQLAQFFGGDREVLLPDADTDDFEGTLVVEVVGGKVAAIALELGTQPGQFTTLPVPR